MKFIILSKKVFPLGKKNPCDKKSFNKIITGIGRCGPSGSWGAR